MKDPDLIFIRNIDNLVTRYAKADLLMLRHQISSQPDSYANDYGDNQRARDAEASLLMLRHRTPEGVGS